MKIYGYLKDNVEDLQELKEITLQGSGSELIEVAHFLLKYAEVMKEKGDFFNHTHMADEYKNWKGVNPDIIVHKGA